MNIALNVLLSTCIFFCYNGLGRDKNVKISQAFPEVGNLGLVLPKDLSKWTTEKVRKGQKFEVVFISKRIHYVCNLQLSLYLK